jgi:hypothetical protein
LAFALFATEQAAAAPSWLAVAADSQCEVEVEPLLARVLEAVAGEPNQSLRVQVRFDDADGGTRATVRTFSDFSETGRKSLVAPTCDEALDAVVAVVALALSSAPDGAAEVVDPRAHETNARRLPHTTRHAVPVVRPLKAAEPDDRGVPSEADGQSTRRVSLAAAADRGTMADPVGLVGLGGALLLGPGELRATAWYGPGERLEVQGAQQSMTRASDFASATLDYCYTMDADRWVSACGGFEVGGIRFVESESFSDGTSARSSGVAPSFGTTASAVFGYRVSTVQPELVLLARFPTGIVSSAKSCA